MDDVQQIVAALQAALGVKISCGQITLNLNESEVLSVETKTFNRLKKPTVAFPLAGTDLTTRQ